MGQTVQQPVVQPKAVTEPTKHTGPVYLVLKNAYRVDKAAANP